MAGAGPKFGGYADMRSMWRNAFVQFHVIDWVCSATLCIHPQYTIEIRLYNYLEHSSKDAPSRPYVCIPVTKKKPGTERLKPSLASQRYSGRKQQAGNSKRCRNNQRLSRSKN